FERRAPGRLRSRKQIRNSQLEQIRNPKPEIRRLEIRSLCLALTFVTIFAAPRSAGWAGDSGQDDPGTGERSSPARETGERYGRTADHLTQSVEGWTIRVNKVLLAEKADLGAKALKLLQVKLYEIRRAVPPAACRKLQEVPIWLGVDDGYAPCAE